MRTRITCPEPGCGTVIQGGPGMTEERLDALLEKHQTDQHGSLAQMHEKVLTACMSELLRVALGGKMSIASARNLHDQVADLLKKPRLGTVPEIQS